MSSINSVILTRNSSDKKSFGVVTPFKIRSKCPQRIEKGLCKICLCVIHKMHLPALSLQMNLFASLVLNSYSTKVSHYYEKCLKSS